MSNLYVFLPDDELGEAGIDGNPLAALSSTMASGDIAGPDFGEGAVSGDQPGRIIEQLGETGACLVEIDSAALDSTKTAHGGTFYPVVYYVPAIANAIIGRSRPLASTWPQGLPAFTLVVKDTAGRPVANANVGLFVAGPQIRLERHEAVTDAKGLARFPIRATAVTAETLFVTPGFTANWGMLKRGVSLLSGSTVTVDTLDMAAAPDALRRLLGSGRPQDGAGVVVGIIDTGVGPHPDLPGAIGDDDTSLGHGTHVAGIVAGRGPAGWAGVAPGVTIRSYRVFDDPATGVAANYRIYQAILRAAADGCHLINLSLKINTNVPGNPDSEPVVRAAIKEAAQRGAVVFAAAGNDSRKPVAFPARVSDCIAVTAIGSESALPANAYDRWTLTKDTATTDPDLFFASFSNQGPEVDLTAPGAGIVSTVPGGSYAPMSGTSMACPAAVGQAARLLSAAPQLLGMAPDRQRHQAVMQLIKASARRIGLGPELEGWGFLR